MSIRAAMVPLLLAAGAAACDPLAGVTVMGALRPAPRPACVDSALRRSDVVREVTMREPSADEKRQGIRQFYTTYPEPSRRDVLGNLAVQTFADSLARVTATVQWIGVLSNAELAERRRYAWVQTALVRELQAACAPTTSEPVQCSEFGIGKSRACTVPPD